LSLLNSVVALLIAISTLIAAFIDSRAKGETLRTRAATKESGGCSETADASREGCSGI